MKQAAQTRNSQAGFSLIELMIVVAIIGILTTIAVPNFNRFQAKARQSEAKGQLAAIYAAEKSFFAEWNRYWGDLRDVGYSPVGRMNYHVGFQGAGTQPGDPFQPISTGPGAGGCFNTFVGVGAGNCGFQGQPTDQLNDLNAFNVATPGGCGQGASASTPDLTTFLATAHGRVSETGEDTWSINEANILCNNTPGI